MDLLPRSKLSLGLVRRFMRYRFIGWRSAVGVHGRRGCHDVPADQGEQSGAAGPLLSFCRGWTEHPPEQPIARALYLLKTQSTQSDKASVTSPKKCNYATRSARTVLRGDAASRRRRY